jgi:2,4-dienoyl-CoA reductase-like NADH-dependent reductase (Old Yellow Enzyme family)
LSKSRFEKLLQPGQIGRVRTRNRMIKTANGTSFIERTGYVGDRALAYYEAMAKGGVGLLITESCGSTRRYSSTWTTINTSPAMPSW